MEIIHVPGPPRKAFNKGRRISDLIRAQIDHLKHLEYKLPADVRDGLPQHEITSEDEAARYIAPMTALLLGQVGASPVAEPGAATGPVAVPQRAGRVVSRPAKGLALAASGDVGRKGVRKKAAGSKPAKRVVKGKKA